MLDPIPALSTSEKLSGEPLAQLGVAPGSEALRTETSRIEAGKLDEVPISGLHGEAFAAIQPSRDKPVRI